MYLFNIGVMHKLYTIAYISCIMFYSEAKLPYPALNVEITIIAVRYNAAYNIGPKDDRFLLSGTCSHILFEVARIYLIANNSTEVKFMKHHIPYYNARQFKI